MLEEEVAEPAQEETPAVSPAQAPAPTSAHPHQPQAPSQPSQPVMLGPGWFCDRPAGQRCLCGRIYCDGHGYHTSCTVCALGYGLFEYMHVPQPVSDLILLSLAAASGDPYIVVPPRLRRMRAMPLPNTEKLVLTLVQMMQSEDPGIRRRAAEVLAGTLHSWPTLDPSRLTEHKHSISLVSVNQVRKGLLQTLKQSRNRSSEPIAVAILEGLRHADFRDLYPAISGKLSVLKTDGLGTRVLEVFQALADFYPTGIYAANERCELLMYEQYMQGWGVKGVLERVHGPRLRQSPILSRLLKKGVWHSDFKRFNEWYPGEEEPD